MDSTVKSNVLSIIFVLQTIILLVPKCYNFLVDKVFQGNVFLFAIVLVIINVIVWVVTSKIVKNYLASEEESIRFNVEYELKKEFEKKEKKLALEFQNIEYRENQVQKIIDSNNIFQKVSSMYADVDEFICDRKAILLETKKNPAPKAADELRALKKSNRDYIEKAKLLEYKYELILNQFPQLRYFADDYQELKEVLNDVSIEDVEYDTARNYLSKEEYNRLSTDERDQLALDNWKIREKSLTQIGFEYELYVGHLYRENGWDVKQYGIDKKFEDLGRDVIATKRNGNEITVHVIQCKCWSRRKEIHENVVNQLFGTTKMLELTYKKALPRYKINVIPVLYCSTLLSSTATEFADMLGVKVVVQPLGDFPHIKCNIGSSGEKIYHLPFDQQYYRTQIKNEGEFYAWTVKEARDKGFRRAFRYYGI